MNIQKGLLRISDYNHWRIGASPFRQPARDPLSLILSVFLPIVSTLNRSSRDKSLFIIYAPRSLSRSAVSSAEPEVGRSSVAGGLVVRAMPSLASHTSRHLSLKRLGGVWASCGFALIDIYLFFSFKLLNLYNLLDP